jgi:hypothetical protein
MFGGEISRVKYFIGYRIERKYSICLVSLQGKKESSDVLLVDFYYVNVQRHAIRLKRDDENDGELYFLSPSLYCIFGQSIDETDASF